jgi:hypothetical protein
MDGKERLEDEQQQEDFTVGPFQPEYYDVIPEYNSSGRLCNYHTGYRDGEDESLLVRVMADEWERFNRLAGRHHEVIDGIVVYNGELEPCRPDDTTVIDPVEDLRYRVAILEVEAGRMDYAEELIESGKLSAERQSLLEDKVEERQISNIEALDKGTGGKEATGDQPENKGE